MNSGGQDKTPTNRSGMVSVGHPVDIASGTVFNQYADFSIAGKFPLKWKRRYSTGLLSESPGPLGWGWTHPFQMHLVRRGNEYHFRNADGALEVFPDPTGDLEKGKILLNAGAFLDLRMQGMKIFVTSWKPGLGDVVRFCFLQGEAGKIWPLVSLEYPDGNGLELAWSEQGWLKAVRQKLERRMFSFEYNVSGRMTKVLFHVPGNLVVPVAKYDYDDLHRLVTFTDALGFKDHFEYDAKGRLVRETNKDGGVFTFKYDAKGRCIRTSGLDKYDLKILKYLDNVNWTEVTDSQGGVYRYERLPSGQVSREINPLGGVTLFEYDGFGRLISETNPIGGKKSYSYDPAGNRFKIGDPDGGEIVLEFNDNHFPVKITNPGGATWIREYDSQGRWTATTDPLGNSWRFEYDTFGNLLNISDPNGSKKVFKRYANGEVAEIIDWNGHSTFYAWDAFGRLAETRNARNQTLKVSHDLMGRITGLLYPDGSRVLASYDAGGNIKTLTSRENRVLEFVFGPCKRLLEAKDFDGTVTRYFWGTEPRQLIRIINGKGEEHRFKYNSLFKIVEERTFDGRILFYTYDAAGRNIRFTNGLGQIIEYEFNGIGRIVNKNYPNGSKVHFDYDANGNMVAAEMGASMLKFERDVLGRIKKEVQGRFTLETAFDKVGSPIRLTTDAGYDVAWEFDPRGATVRTTILHQFTFHMERDVLGLEIRREMPNQALLTQSYNDDGRLKTQHLSGILDGDSSPSAIHRVFEFSPDGNLMSVSDSVWGDVRLEYDGANRLLRTLSETFKETFQYDLNGNITDKSLASPTQSISEHLAIGPGNRLVSRGDFTFEYDAAGRLVRKIQPLENGKQKTWTYEWDFEDQLIRFADDKGDLWIYEYDALGRRISKSNGSRKIEYLWDRRQIIQVFKPDSPVESWVYSLHGFDPLAKVKSGRVFPIIADYLGTPREMLDDKGQVVWSAQLQAWGAVREIRVNLEDCPIRFPGQWFDSETGLHYSLFRYYDPESGQFISPDPLGVKAGLNEYVYAINPTGWTDPYGLCPGDSKDDPIVVIVDKDKYPEAAQHIEDFGPVVGQIDRPGAAARRREKLKDVDPVPDKDRDEVPPAVLRTDEGTHSIRAIDPSDNRGAGSSVGHALRPYPNGTWVEIRSS
jgi:RHS repeat-associated protein